MSERDKLIEKIDQENKLFIVTPTPMFDYMEDFRVNTLRYPEMVVLVPSNDLNPENVLYYEEKDKKSKR